ncbi:hypothetical protein JHK85_036193 [Glycine max]|nr:hypothetical protein JHK85_036193 [Glycine max]
MVLEEDEHGGLLADRSNSLVQRSRGKLSTCFFRQLCGSSEEILTKKRFDKEKILKPSGGLACSKLGVDFSSRVSSSLSLPSPKPHPFSISNLTDFPSLLTHFSSHTPTLPIASTSKWARPSLMPLLKTLSVLDRALIGVAAGGLAGAFTYVCLLPLNIIKTKMKIKGATQIYKNNLDAIVKTFQSEGIISFYNGMSTVVVCSTTLPRATRSSKRTRIVAPRLGKLQRLLVPG